MAVPTFRYATNATLAHSITPPSRGTTEEGKNTTQCDDYSISRPLHDLLYICILGGGEVTFRPSRCTQTVGKTMKYYLFEGLALMAIQQYRSRAGT